MNMQRWTRWTRWTLALAGATLLSLAAAAPLAHAQTLDADWLAINALGDTSNKEMEAYNPAQCSVASGQLVQTAIHATYLGQPYTSCAVTWATYNFTYGVVEFRARLAGGTGGWPAIWLLGYKCQPTSADQLGASTCNWPQPGSDEVDIAELLNSDALHVNQEIHSSTCANCGCTAAATNVTQNYHTYDFVDSPTGGLKWYIDGALTCSEAASALSATPHYLIANVAVGGTGTVTPNAATFPQSTNLSYVKVWTTNVAYPTVGTPDKDFEFGGAPTAPAEPGTPQAAATTHSATLTWTDATAGATFNVLRATAAAGPFATLASGLSAFTYVDGTVVAGATYFYEVTATNAGGTSAPSSVIQVTIPANSPLPLSFLTTSLPSGTVGVAYTSAVAATGGTPPYTYSASALVPGLSLSASTGALTGTPTTAGSYTEAFSVQDSSSPALTALASYSVAISAAAPPPPPPSCTAAVPVYVRAGGPSLKVGSVTWTGDLGFSGGTDYLPNFSIKGTTSAYPAALVNGERWGVMQDVLPVVSGCKYTLTYGASESTFTAAKKRIFSVTVNGTAFLTNLDLYAATGGIHILKTWTTTVTATGSSVTLAFLQGSADQPKVDFISLVPSH